MSGGTDDLLQGTLDLLILKTLGLGPNHGLGIARRICAPSARGKGLAFVRVG